MWSVILLDEVRDWYLALDDETTTSSVTAAINLLAGRGPMLGRPTADQIKGSRIHKMKELRPAGTSVRILFVLDPERQAVLLVAGDKAGAWRQWYQTNIPIAEERYEAWLAGEYNQEV